MADKEVKREIALDAPPEVIGEDCLLKSAHDLPTDVDPAWAGEYELTHGLLRVAVADGKGGFIPRGKVYRGRQYETRVKTDPRTDKPVVDAKTGQPVKEEILIASGARVRLSAIDAFRFMQAGVVKRIDGKRPDRIEEVAA